MPHQHFLSAPGTAFAENEFPAAPLNPNTIQVVLQQVIAAFVSEGPSGGHFQNIMGGYSQLGCGVFGDKINITVVQDFR